MVTWQQFFGILHHCTNLTGDKPTPAHLNKLATGHTHQAIEWSRGVRSTHSTMAQNSRTKPNILVTGTPGTGKTTTSAALAEATQLRHINVGELVKEKNLHDGWDDQFDCHVINEDLVQSANPNPNPNYSKRKDIYSYTCMYVCMYACIYVLNILCGICPMLCAFLLPVWFLRNRRKRNISLRTYIGLGRSSQLVEDFRLFLIFLRFLDNQME